MTADMVPTPDTGTRFVGNIPPRLDLPAFLGELRGERFAFFPNHGNGGDCLIALGAYQLFQRLGLDYDIVSPNSDPEAARGRTLVIAGGGNLVPFYYTCRKFIRHRKDIAKRIIILPHTIKAHEDVLGAIECPLDIICRETMSFEFVTSAGLPGNHHISDDLAFHIDVEDALTGRIRNTRPMTLKQWAKYVRQVYARMSLPAPSSPVFTCFRTDNETSGRHASTDSIDLSSRFVPGTEPERMAEMGVRDIFRHLSRFKRVRTDRLHISIAGALLDLEVEMYDNNYKKNRMIYEYSLKGKFENVTFFD